MTEAERLGLIIYNVTENTIRINMPPIPPTHDLFGHYISSNVTFKPKDRVRINVPGPFDGLTGYVVNYVGDHKYTVSITPKDKTTTTLTFHRSELRTLNYEINYNPPNVTKDTL